MSRPCVHLRGGFVTQQPLPSTTISLPSLQHRSSSKRHPYGKGALAWMHLQEVWHRSRGTESNRNHRGYPPTTTLAIFLGIPAAGGYKFPLEVGSH